METIKFITATASCIDFIFESLKNMAIEQNILKRFVKNKYEIKKLLFDKKIAQCIIALNELNTPVGLAIYSETNRNFTLFSSLGMYIHDIYIKPEYRNQKIATNLIKYLKNIAIKNN